MLSVRKLRGKLGLSQQELADKLGVSRTSVMWWESPDCDRLSEKTQTVLCEVFECDLIDLYGADNLRIKPQTEEEKQRIIEYVKQL